MLIFVLLLVMLLNVANSANYEIRFTHYVTSITRHAHAGKLSVRYD